MRLVRRCNNDERPGWGYFKSGRSFVKKDVFYHIFVSLQLIVNMSSSTVSRWKRFLLAKRGGFSSSATISCTSLLFHQFLISNERPLIEVLSKVFLSFSSANSRYLRMIQAFLFKARHWVEELCINIIFILILTYHPIIKRGFILFERWLRWKKKYIKNWNDQSRGRCE